MPLNICDLSIRDLSISDLSIAAAYPDSLKLMSLWIANILYRMVRIAEVNLNEMTNH